MRILVTGADGFVGKNLAVRAREVGGVEIVPWVRATSPKDIERELPTIDFVIHLAGVNRPKDPAEFQSGNAGLTETLCRLLRETSSKIPVVYSSSAQASLDNPYGLSKRQAEDALLALKAENGNPVAIYRLPNIFGKWSRPNYNSAVATFCHNTINDLPITINDPNALLTMVYVDDVVNHFLALAKGESDFVEEGKVHPEYKTTVGDVHDLIRSFKESRKSLVTERVGTGLTRALYATYVSFLKPDQFAYPVPKYGDPRGIFAEMLKTQDSGQFSFFTAHPGITRGGHYHHTKTEKFLVLKGKARFKFRHILTSETSEIYTSGDDLQVVETVPGWSHDITNVGTDEMYVMLWANEIFDRQKPDTVAHEV